MAYTQAEREWIFAEANKRAASNGSTVKQEIAKEAQKAGMDLSTAAQNMGWAPDYLTNSGSAPAAKAPNQWDTAINAIRTAAAGATPNLGIGSNMVVSGAGNQAAVNTPMPAAAPAGGGGAVGAGTAVPEARLPGVGSPEVIPSGDGRWNGDPTRNPDGSYRGGNLGIGDTGYQRNPYLDATSRDIGAQMFDQWNRNVAPGLRSGAMATGGYGGSRQGVVEANALNDLGRNYSQALTGMYGTDYTNYQNRGIQRQGQAQSYDLGLGGLANQRYGQDQSYDLGLRNNALGWQGQAQSYDLGLRNSDLGFASLDANINNSNFNNQMTAANFGLGVQDYLNKNNAIGIAAGTQINNAPWDYQKYLNSAGNQAGSGWNTSTTTKTGG